MKQQKLYMIKRWWKIATGKSATAVRQKEGQVYSIGKISGYYNDFSGKLSGGTVLDEEGIPLTIIAGNKKAHFPIAICQYGLGCYDRYIQTNEKLWEEKFLTILNYIYKIQKKSGAWDCFGPLESKEFTVSSMCQGEAASLLLRGYMYKKEDMYLEAAKKAIDFMLLPIEHGGTAVYADDDLYLEEYPRKERRMGVLNGWIFSLFGIWDLSMIYPEYKEIFDRSCITLLKHLDDYDAGYWSFYDLDRRIASPAYHDLHIELIKALRKMYPNEKFDEFIGKLIKYQNDKCGKRKAIFRKIIQKLNEKSDSVVVQ